MTQLPKTPEWAKNAVIYEVNIRQYTPEGSISSFVRHLPRLKELGVEILWIMPVQPVGLKNRKGTRGSYYSIRDYMDISDEYGTMDDFRNMVDEAHRLGMYVLLDWVANHTSWDNPLLFSHPDWYSQDDHGNRIMPAGTDWADVADLNYSNSNLREYMIGAMKFWLTETDIDGFRCDMAGLVPTDFWNDARTELDAVKEVFMLAEWDDPVLHEKAFDMSYTWSVHHCMNDIAQGTRAATDLEAEIHHDRNRFGESALRMFFTSNHDENSWKGSAPERFGPSLRAFTVLTWVLPGMPLIYSGQEAGLSRSLAFFDKDQIEWKEDEMAILYRQLNALKHENRALWSGRNGGTLAMGSTDRNQLWVLREQEHSQVLAIVNLQHEESIFHINDPRLKGEWQNLSGEKFSTGELLETKLDPWGYLLVHR